MIIKILGTGCPKCKLLQKSVEEAVEKMGLDCEIIKVDDMNDIMQYDVMAMPALVIDEKVVLAGKIPEVEEMTDILLHQKPSKDDTKGCDCGHNDECCGGGCGCD